MVSFLRLPFSSRWFTIRPRGARDDWSTGLVRTRIADAPPSEGAPFFSSLQVIVFIFFFCLLRGF